MFKKRTAKKRNPIQIERREEDVEEGIEQGNDIEGDIANSITAGDGGDDMLNNARWRDKKANAKRVNKMSTTVQDVTSKVFMNREVQDLTNNYTSSSKAKEI